MCCINKLEAARTKLTWYVCIWIFEVLYLLEGACICNCIWRPSVVFVFVIVFENPSHDQPSISNKLDAVRLSFCILIRHSCICNWSLVFAFVIGCPTPDQPSIKQQVGCSEDPTNSIDVFCIWIFEVLYLLECACIWRPSVPYHWQASSNRLDAARLFFSEFL